MTGCAGPVGRLVRTPSLGALWFSGLSGLASPALSRAAMVVPGWWGGGVAAGGVRVMASFPWWTVRW